MKEIKFKGKKIDTGEWLTDMHTLIQDADGTWLQDADGCYKVEDAFLFTGLQDSKKVDIYEEDTIRYLDYSNNTLTIRTSKVIYYEGCFVFEMPDKSNRLLCMINPAEIEVVGL